MPSVGDGPSVSAHTPARRGVLAVVAAAVGGGCLNDVASTSSEERSVDTDASSRSLSTDQTPTRAASPDATSPPRSSTTTPTHADVGPDWPTPDSGARPAYTTDPAATTVVGDADERPSNVEPHQVVVSAAGGTETASDTSTTDDPTATDDTRVTTRVWRNGTRVVARTDTLPAGLDLLVDLQEPGRYLVAVRAARDERGVVVSNRDRTWFDCNESATTVAVTPDGYARGFITTDLACATPE